MKITLPSGVPLQHLALPEIQKDLVVGVPLEVTPEELALVMPRLGGLFVHTDDVNGVSRSRVTSAPVEGDQSFAALAKVEE